MLLSSVVFVLQETLEAALLISVLMAISYQQQRPLKWLLTSLGGGFVLSCAYARNMPQISEWFDFVGQEVVNAVLHASISLLIVFFTCSFMGYETHSKPSNGVFRKNSGRLYFITATGCVTAAITLEGSELLIYLTGFSPSSSELQTVLMGSSIGFAIGVSLGILLFYILRGLPILLQQPIALFLLALFAGNMLSQSVLQLIQADWISSTQAVWDTSRWLPENTVTGRLLYALIGYEATPSLAQIIGYVAGTGLVLIFGIIRRSTKTTLSAKQTTQQ